MVGLALVVAGCGVEAVGMGAIEQVGPWEDFDVRLGGLCGVTRAGDLDCPHAGVLGVTLPAGEFAEVALTGGGALAGCGRQVSGEVACFDVVGGSRLVEEVPSGVFEAIAGHSRVHPHACGVTEEGAVVCWGDGLELTPPEGVFLPVLSGWNDTWCGLRRDGTLACWQSTTGGSRDVLDNVPGGVFDAVTVGNAHACALQGTRVTCWGRLPEGDVPDRELLVVDGGELNVCGVLPDGAGACWGSNGWGQLGVPGGGFVRVRPAAEQVCGLRENGEVECWGFSL